MSLILSLFFVEFKRRANVPDKINSTEMLRSLKPFSLVAPGLSFKRVSLVWRTAFRNCLNVFKTWSMVVSESNWNLAQLN